MATLKIGETAAATAASAFKLSFLNELVEYV